MFRQWRWMPFPKKRGQCDVAKRDRTATEFTAAPDRMKKLELNGYLVFLDDAYRADPPGPDGKPTGRETAVVMAKIWRPAPGKPSLDLQTFKDVLRELVEDDAFIEELHYRYQDKLTQG